MWIEQGIRLAGLALIAAATTGAPAAAQTSASAATRWVVAADGNEARYRVREQLAGFEFPNDAVGATSAVNGAIVFAADGTIDRATSHLEIDLTALKSDEDRRDNYLRRNTLNTEEHPRATFLPTAIRGLPTPLPSSGEAAFELVGDFTVRGVTRPVVWTVTATFASGTVSGQAKTQFTFDDMGLTKPRLARLLSVADEIRLEYDFKFVVEQ